MRINFAGLKTYTKKINGIFENNENEIFLSHLIIDNIGGQEFIKFLDELLEQYDEEKIIKLLVVMDNAKFHVSKQILEFLRIKNIKIITNVSYLSNFNSIELLFRDLKNIIIRKHFAQ